MSLQCGVRINKVQHIYVCVVHHIVCIWYRVQTLVKVDTINLLRPCIPETLVDVWAFRLPNTSRWTHTTGGIEVSHGTNDARKQPVITLAMMVGSRTG